MLYPAETFFQYSNLGLTLAVKSPPRGRQAYAELVRQSILDPLGLRSTTPTCPPASAASAWPPATAAWGARARVSRCRSSRPTASRRPPATPRQSRTWRALLVAVPAAREGRHGGALRDHPARDAPRPLDRHGLHELVRPRVLRLAQRRQDVRRHGGSCPGFRSHLLLKPDEKLATVFMANAQGVNATQYPGLYDIVGPSSRRRRRRRTRRRSRRCQTRRSRLRRLLRERFSGTETAVVLWEDGLAMLPLPTTDPVTALVKIRKAGDHTFRASGRTKRSARPSRSRWARTPGAALRAAQQSVRAAPVASGLRRRRLGGAPSLTLPAGAPILRRRALCRHGATTPCEP